MWCAPLCLDDIEVDAPPADAIREPDIFGMDRAWIDPKARPNVMTIIVGSKRSVGVPLPQAETRHRVTAKLQLSKEIRRTLAICTDRLRGYGKINRKVVSSADRRLCPDVGGSHDNPRLKRRPSY